MRIATSMALLAALSSLTALAGCGYSDVTVGALNSADAGRPDAQADAGLSDGDAGDERDLGAADAGAEAGVTSDGGAVSLVVTNTNDSGPGSLRAALASAGTLSSGTITFDIPNSDPGHLYYRDNAGAGLGAPVTTNQADAALADLDPDYPAGTARSWWRIVLQSPLPATTVGISVSGLSQKSARGVTANGPVIELDGAGAGASTGLSLTGSLDGVVLSRFAGTAARLSGPGVVARCIYSGVDPSGLLQRGNRVGLALAEVQGAAVGGLLADDRNVLSGNSEVNLWLSGSSTADVLLHNNFVGPDATGLAIPLPAARATAGLRVTDGASNVRLRTTVMRDINVISGNVVGIHVQNASDVSLDLTLVGASGFDAGGVTSDLGNTSHGVLLENASSCYIGQSIVLWNGGAGVLLLSGDGNVFRENAILDNAGLGIDLAPLGVNPPPSGTSGSGPNAGQHHPVIVGLLAGPRRLSVQLTSRPNTSYELDLQYETGGNNTLGFAQLNQDLATVTTDGAGFASVEMPVTIQPDPGAILTLTATELAGATYVRTSERVTLPGGN
jgi:hypothetical protein